MKKTLGIIVLLAVVAMLLPAVAAASGWYTTPNPSGVSVHSGYQSGSQKCVVCHAIHGAENAANSLNGEKLLRSTVAGSCDYCHVGGPFSATQVYQSNVVKYGQDTGYEHSIGAAFTQILDSNDATTANAAFNPATDYTITGGLKCTSCHSVHGVNTILNGGANADILKINPNPSNATSAPANTNMVTQDFWWCGDCHTSNFVTTHDAPTGGFDTFSHIMTSSIVATMASSASDQCRDCHSGASVIASRSAGNNYPHYTAGKYFLKDAFNQTGTVRYDSVCIDCHPSGTIW